MLFAPLLEGAIQLSQNLVTAPSSWSGAPLLSSVTNPNGQATVAEDFTGGGGVGTLSQTFTIPAGTNYLLTRVELLAGGGTGTSEASPLALALYDLGEISVSSLTAYANEVSLLNGGSPAPLAYSSQSTGLLRLDFTGADQVFLRAGHVYALELSGAKGSSPLRWFRNTSDTYAGGLAYRGRAWINGTNARDFAFALYATSTLAEPAPIACTLAPGTRYQTMDGFGAGVVFLDSGLSPLSSAQMDTLYGTADSQIGLTLLRTRIAPYGDWSGAVPDARQAVQRGARILATPWTPPAAMKDNNNTVAGSLLPSQYANYAKYLNDFALYMAANGAPLSVISLQNEPDYRVTYESCDWTAAQLRTFMVENAPAITAAPIMIPESYNFTFAVSDAALNDPVAAPRVGYVGGHLYGATVRDYALARSLGKPVWMTEYLENDQTIESAIGTARHISHCLSVGNMSAYIWWKLIGNANGLLNAAGVPQRRSYVMGQFSRFIRPGDTRIGVSGNAGPLDITAFQRPRSTAFAIVAVNATNGAVRQQFKLGTLPCEKVYPVVTTSALSLSVQAPLSVTAGAFDYEVPALAVVSFVTENPNSTPAAPQIVQEPTGITVSPGESVVLTPTVSGFPTPVVTWWRNGVEVPGNTTSLVLSAVSSADEGEYSFTVTNASGTVHSNGILVGVRNASSRREQLLNISTRGQVVAGGGGLIAGFAIHGDVPVQVLIRGVGKPLEAFGVPNALQNPVLTLNQVEPAPNRVIATNDTWGTQANAAAIREAFAATGAFAIPSDSTDSCLLLWLRPGLYTATLTGAGDTGGNAIIEVYQVPAP